MTSIPYPFKSALKTKMNDMVDPFAHKNRSNVKPKKYFILG